MDNPIEGYLARRFEVQLANNRATKESNDSNADRVYISQFLKRFKLLRVLAAIFKSNYSATDLR